MARRDPLVIFAFAPCTVRPLWKEQLPAFIGAATGMGFLNCGYTSKMLSIFLPIVILSKPVCLCEPGIKNKQPFSSVALSSATHIEIALRSEKDQNGVSKCQAVGFAQGRLIKAWSCQILIPSTRANCAAILPIRSSIISSFTC